MALKTFNIEEEIYKKFSAYCRKEGISMSRRIENFLRGELEKIGSKGRVGRNIAKIVEKKVLELNPEEHPLSKYC